MTSLPKRSVNTEARKRTLILAPCLDDGSGRGLAKVTLNLIDSLSSIGHEIIIFTGAPANNWRSSQSRINSLLNSRLIGHYLSGGIKSDAFSLSKKTYVNSLIRFTLAYIKLPTLIEIVKPSSSHRSDLIKSFDKVDYFINISMFYQITRRSFLFLNSILVFRVARKIGADFVICTSPTKISKPNDKKYSKIRLVQYVHDLLPLTSPETPTDSVMKFASVIDNVIEGSDYIITNSRQTLTQLKKIKPNLRGSVVYVSIKKQVLPNLYYPTQLFNSGSGPKSYMLFMSVLESRKNVINLLEAYSYICDSISCDLVLVGSKGYGWEKISEMIDSFPDSIKKRIHIKGYVRDSEKWSLLKGCELFVHPATDEGLGLPVIEALSEKIPVVATRLSSIEEFAPNNSIVYIENPYDSVDIADKLLSAVHNIEQIKQRTGDIAEEVNHFFSEFRLQQRLKRALRNVMEE